MSEMEQMQLELDNEVLLQLVSLLPSGFVNVRQYGFTVPQVPSYAISMLREALVRGYLIDRSNGQLPLKEWDGWLSIDIPDAPARIQLRRENPSPG